jgi:hypothetical protein
LPVDVLFKLGHPLPAQTIDLRGMDNSADCVDGLSVDEQLQLDELALPPACVFVIERRVSLSIQPSSQYHPAR